MWSHLNSPKWLCCLLWISCVLTEAVLCSGRVLQEKCLTEWDKEMTSEWLQGLSCFGASGDFGWCVTAFFLCFSHRENNPNLGKKTKNLITLYSLLYSLDDCAFKTTWVLNRNLCYKIVMRFSVLSRTSCGSVFMWANEGSQQARGQESQCYKRSCCLWQTCSGA